VRVEEQSHALDAQIAISVLCSLERVYLRVGVEVTATLNVNHNQLVSGAFEGEVTEGLRSLTTLIVVHES